MVCMQEDESGVVGGGESVKEMQDEWSLRATRTRE